MESTGAVIEGEEWSSFNGVYVNEEADFMAQLFPNSSLPNELDSGSSLGVGTTCWASQESHFSMGGVDNSIYSSDSANSNLYFSQESSFSGGSNVIYPTAHGNYYMSDPHQFLVANNNSVSIDFCMTEAKTTSFIQVFPDRMEGDDCFNQEMSGRSMDESGVDPTEAELADKHLQLQREAEMSEMDLTVEDKSFDSLENSKKRSRVPDAQKGKRNTRAKKNQKLSMASNNDDDNSGGLNRQSSSSCSSEDDSNGSQEANAGDTSSLSSKGVSALNLNGKTRASRGSATDPQSLYARKRRERINERLRILQNLVPNGTKVDISTMLEEAVQYVKFLQLQIKLLSSDDLWMYAPIAYNGMDIGLDLKINTPR